MKKLIEIYRTCTQPIDFQGQIQAKRNIYLIFGIGFTISYIFGIIMNDLKYTLILGIITIVLNLIVVVPPWPMYRRNPDKFLEKEKND